MTCLNIKEWIHEPFAPKIAETGRFFITGRQSGSFSINRPKIANRAELNRATFYLHYEDINDLLRQVVHEIFDDLSMKVEPLLQVKSRNERGS